jgi:hypothetical protein
MIDKQHPPPQNSSSAPVRHDQSALPLSHHPVLQELRARRKELAQRLAALLEEARVIMEVVNPPILDTYDTLFRAAQIQLQKLTVEAAEVRRREELFRLKLERGEKLTPETIKLVHGIVDREFARIRRTVAEALDDAAKGKEQQQAYKRTKSNRKQYGGSRTDSQIDNAENTERTQELVRIYRAVVKKLHPDTHTYNSARASEHNTVAHLAADQYRYHKELSEQQSTLPPEFDKFWHQVQEAYKEGNIKRLQSIYDIVCLTEEEQVSDTLDTHSAEEYLRAEIGRLARRVHAEETKLKNLQTAEPYILKDVIHDECWQQQERERLAHDTALKKQDIMRSRAFLDSIHAGLDSIHAGQGTDRPVFPPNDNLSSSDDVADEKNFQTDFMENTYFSQR